jgi:hypothetical protein
MERRNIFYCDSNNPLLLQWHSNKYREGAPGVISICQRQYSVTFLGSVIIKIHLRHRVISPSEVGHALSCQRAVVKMNHKSVISTCGNVSRTMVSAWRQNWQSMCNILNSVDSMPGLYTYISLPFASSMLYIQAFFSSKKNIVQRQMHWNKLKCIKGTMHFKSQSWIAVN